MWLYFFYWSMRPFAATKYSEGNHRTHRIHRFFTESLAAGPAISWRVLHRHHEIWMLNDQRLRRLGGFENHRLTTIIKKLLPKKQKMNDSCTRMAICLNQTILHAIFFVLRLVSSYVYRSRPTSHVSRQTAQASTSNQDRLWKCDIRQRKHEKQKRHTTRKWHAVFLYIVIYRGGYSSRSPIS